MKVVIINGVSHKGSTNFVARKLAEKLSNYITEFFLPRDFNHNCLGCWTCYNTSLDKCPHYQDFEKIYLAMLEADVIILASPVYVFHTTGSMKNFLDHFGVKWLVHRPEPKMFSKCGVCISTAAGAGMKSANKDMADSLSFYGIPRIFNLGFAVYTSKAQNINPKVLKKIEKSTSKVAKKVKKINFNKKRASIKSRFYFYLMRIFHKKGLMGSAADYDYWHNRGWHGKERPWK